MNDKETWDEAEQQCQENFGAHLAQVESNEHLEWLWHLSEGHSVWIGVNCSLNREDRHKLKFKPNSNNLSGISLIVKFIPLVALIHER